MYISPLKMSPLASRGSAPFVIDHSFLLDGVDEFFTIPKAELSGTLSGANKKITIGFSMKRSGGLGSQQIILADDILGSMNIQFSTANTIRFLHKDVGVNKTVASSETWSTGTWIHGIITYDYSQSLGSRVKMYVNDVALTITSDTSTTNIDVPTTDYKIGERSGVNNFDGNVLQLFALNDIPTASQRTDWYHGGKPKNPQSIWGANCKWFFNPDDSGSTAQFSVVDSTNSVTATSSNLEDSDKTTTTPY